MSSESTTKTHKKMDYRPLIRGKKRRESVKSRCNNVTVIWGGIRGFQKGSPCCGKRGWGKTVNPKTLGEDLKGKPTPRIWRTGDIRWVKNHGELSLLKKKRGNNNRGSTFLHGFDRTLPGKGGCGD